jgi:hypothetical protein
MIVVGTEQLRSSATTIMLGLFVRQGFGYGVPPSASFSGLRSQGRSS